jgi:hypothetical protein
MAGATGLSPEALLHYMRSNLEGLDEQIAGALQDMNARREQTARMTQALNKLREFKQLDSVQKDRDGEQHRNDGVRTSEDGRETGEHKDLENILVEAGISAEEADRLVDGFGGRADENDVQSLIDRLSDDIGQLNNQNEYESLRINDLLSKRGQLVQMVSKMMASMQETANATIQNIR